MRGMIAAIILGLLAGFWETAAFPFLPWWGSFRPLLVVTVLFLAGGRRSQALAAAIAGGILLDAYRVSGFDVSTLRWAALVLLLDWIARQFLTNRSLYATVGLVLIGRAVDAVSIGILSVFGEWALSSGPSTAFPRLAVWAWDVVLAGLGFLFLAFLTRRFVSDAGRNVGGLMRYG